jgi:hypothetical protein
VLADEADGLSNVVRVAAWKRTEPVLDWFHIQHALAPDRANVVQDAGKGVVVNYAKAAELF